MQSNYKQNKLLKTLKGYMASIRKNCLSTLNSINFIREKFRFIKSMPIYILPCDNIFHGPFFAYTPIFCIYMYIKFGVQTLRQNPWSWGNDIESYADFLPYVHFFHVLSLFAYAPNFSLLRAIFTRTILRIVAMKSKESFNSFT